MENKQVTVTYQLADLDELSEKDQLLIERSNEVMQHAYAVYSGFSVGAALELENGKIVTGSNQENAAYPSGLCAERVAIFYAHSQYPNVSIQTIAITASSDRFSVNDPVPPCGACRQVMVEYEQKQNKPMRILLAGRNGKVCVINGIAQLMPLLFNPEELRL